MKVYEINPANFGKYKHKLNDILKKPNMCGVFSKSCGHCEFMKPEWNKLKQKVAAMPGEGSLIEIDSQVIPEINYRPLTQRIEGFPTILIIKQGIPKMEYNGDRSFHDMFQYFKKNLSQRSPSIVNSNSIRNTPDSNTNYNSIPQNIPTIINEDEPSIKKTQKRRRKRKSTQKGGSKKNNKKKSRCVCCNKKARCTKKCICRSTCNPSCPCCRNKKRKHTR